MEFKMEVKNTVHKKWGKIRKGRGQLSDYPTSRGCSQRENKEIRHLNRFLNGCLRLFTGIVRIWGYWQEGLGHDLWGTPFFTGRRFPVLQPFLSLHPLVNIGCFIQVNCWENCCPCLSRSDSACPAPRPPSAAAWMQAVVPRSLQSVCVEEDFAILRFFIAYWGAL